MFQRQQTLRLFPVDSLAAREKQIITELEGIITNIESQNKNFQSSKSYYSTGGMADHIHLQLVIAKLILERMQDTSYEKEEKEQNRKVMLADIRAEVFYLMNHESLFANKYESRAVLHEILGVIHKLVQLTDGETFKASLRKLFLNRHTKAELETLGEANAKYKALLTLDKLTPGEEQILYRNDIIQKRYR